MIRRATLYKWLQLEEIKENLFTAVEEGNHPDFLAHLYQYLTTAVDIEKDWSKLPWIEIRDLFIEIEEVNAPTKPFPILQSSQRDKTAHWGYEGRTWYFWLNLFLDHYGWNIESVKQLDIDDAIGLIQEILLSEQQRRDFIWTTTEVGYRYNPKTKKSRLEPLNRPDWMKQGIIVEEPKKIKIRRDFLPVGKTVSWEERNA